MSKKGKKSFEIERKYEAPEGALLPLSFTSAGLTLLVEDSFEMTATYFDTSDSLLAAHGVALRKRFGGEDEGWHIKIKQSTVSTEYFWPLEDNVPMYAMEKLKKLINTETLRLIPVATINTSRRHCTLANLNDKHVCYLADDEVNAEDHVTDVKRSWREWESELAPDAERDYLDKIEPFLLEAGAYESLSHSKIARARGASVETALQRGFSAEKLAALAVTDLADRIAGSNTTGKLQVKRMREIALANLRWDLLGEKTN